MIQALPKERVVLLCVQFPALSSCRQSLHGARCSLGGVSGALWKSLPVCWKCVWWGGGAYSRCRWALAFSVISLSVGGPRHACLQNWKLGILWPCRLSRGSAEASLGAGLSHWAGKRPDHISRVSVADWLLLTKTGFNFLRVWILFKWCDEKRRSVSGDLYAPFAHCPYRLSNLFRTEYTIKLSW